jgi:CRISPR-associated protein Cmr5
MSSELKRPVARPVSPEKASAKQTQSSGNSRDNQKISVSTSPKDLDRSRAAEAWKAIQAIKTKSYQGKYGSLARKMPTLIQVNGLGQTLAFLKAKGNGQDHHDAMFNNLSSWVSTRVPGDGDLLNRALNMDSKTYRRATSESLSFLQWLKRFAEAELGNEEED